MLRVCLYSWLQHYTLLLLVTSASDLPMHTVKLCFALFDVSVHACCHKQDSLMRGHSSSEGLGDKQTPPL